MKRLLLSSVLVLSLGGCFMPSGINPTLGCSQITGCQQKDFYLPGKGVWAPKPMFGPKATVGAVGGAVIGASLGKDVTTAALFSVVGLVLGHQVGTTMDKVDEIHGAMLIRDSLDNNQDGQFYTWKNPKKNLTISSGPTKTLPFSTKYGKCREFVTTVIVEKEERQMKGTACLGQDGVWNLKELYR